MAVLWLSCYLFARDFILAGVSNFISSISQYIVLLLPVIQQVEENKLLVSNLHLLTCGLSWFDV